MLKDTIFNSTNKETLCLNTKPLQVKRRRLLLYKITRF